MAVSYDDLVFGASEGSNFQNFFGKSGYAPHNKLYYSPRERLSTTVNELTDIICETLEEITDNRGPIDEFVIGKTFARKRKYQDFDPCDFNTWKLADGINGRWKSKYKPEGFDGLIVLRAFIRESLPVKDHDLDGEETWSEDEPGPLFNPQDYSLAVEQQLIHHFAYEKMDPRLGNSSLSTGNVEKKGAKAYVIYMAFKLDREE